MFVTGFIADLGLAILKLTESPEPTSWSSTSAQLRMPRGVCIGGKRGGRRGGCEAAAQRTDERAAGRLVPADTTRVAAERTLDICPYEVDGISFRTLMHAVQSLRGSGRCGKWGTGPFGIDSIPVQGDFEHRWQIGIANTTLCTSMSLCAYIGTHMPSVGSVEIRLGARRSEWCA